MRVLIVESDRATGLSMDLMLKGERFPTIVVEGLGKGAIELATAYRFDIILLALNLFDMSGYEVLRTLRAEKKVVTPVIIVSGLTEVQDKVKGLWLGADDYLTKPFHKDELVARIHAVMRRCQEPASTVVKVGTLTLDFDKRSIDVAGKPRYLTRKEFSVLEILVLQRGSLVTKEEILIHLYGKPDTRDIKVIDVFVSKLRKKIQSNSGARDAIIETVWGRGYLLKERAQVV